MIRSFVVLQNDADVAPTEFRLFRSGLNRTSKGDFLFDEQAADSVMSEYRQHGADIMVDLEHLSLNPESKSYDPDARAWLNLEVRNGELWAVNVRWTDDGVSRLASKKQRYVSPAFETDKNNRIVSILNIALVGMPATHQPAALVAANRLGASMDPELVKKAIDAIAAGDSDGALALLQEMIATAAGDGSAEPEPDPAASEPEPGSEPDDASQLAEDEPAEDDEEKKDASALNVLRTLIGIKDRDDLIAEVKSLSARVAEVEAREFAAEQTERKQLVASLVKLGVELPSTAWVGDASERKLCERLSSEPLDELRSRVQALSAVPAQSRRRPPAAPTVQLSKAELAACKTRGITPEEFAERKARAVKRTAV